MKKILLTTALVLPLASSGWSQAQRSDKAPPSEMSSPGNARSSQTNPGLVDASVLEGRTVKNPQGEELGEIERLLVDPRSGRVRYAVIEVDKAWQWNDPKVEVPFQSLQVTGQGDEPTIVLDTTKERLEKAPRFRDDNMQAMSGAREASDTIYRYWSILWFEDPTPANQTARNDAASGAPASATARDSRRDQADRGKQAFIRAQQIDDARLYDKEGKDIGEVSDVLLDENTGRIHFAVLDIGGWLGVDETHVLASWDQLQARGGESGGYTVAADREKLRTAPRFEGWDMVNEDLYRRGREHWTPKNRPATDAKLVRASEVREAKLFDRNGREIGAIEGLIVNPRKGRVAYGVVSLENAPSADRNLTAVPFDRIRQSPQKTPGYVLEIDEARMKDARFFGANDWPDLNSRDWAQELDSHFAAGDRSM